MCKPISHELLHAYFSDLKKCCETKLTDIMQMANSGCVYVKIALKKLRTTTGNAIL